MTDGPGKYDDLCTAARVTTDAQAVVMIVLGGTKGSGFSVQAEGGSITGRLPALLRSVADQIERDYGRMQ